MDIRLSNEKELHDFERGIADLIRQSALQRAEHLLTQAAGQFGSQDLRNAIETTQEKAGIDGWDTLCADMLEANQRLGEKGVALVRLSLVNRQEGDRLVEDLIVERRFFSSAELNKYGNPDGSNAPGSGRPVRLTGLDDLMAIQRRRSGDARDTSTLQWQIDNVLSGLLLILRYNQVVDRWLRERGLPLEASLIVEMDHVARPMEVGVLDFGPQVQRLIGKAEHQPKPFNAAAEMLAERTAERRAHAQAEVNRMIAEYRETYRIVRMFPFYRFQARNKLAGLFDGQLKMACQARKLPETGVGWRMGKRAFEDFLRRLVESMNPPSVAAALDPVHVDQLHERWLSVAKTKSFNLGSSPLSLFEVHLAWALKFGGPFVQDRWEHAKPYSVDR